MTFEELKRLNQNGELKKALQDFGTALNIAALRFMTENPSMSVETARNMNDLRDAVNWLAKNIDRDKLDEDNEVEQKYFDFCSRILPTAGHILNDPVEGRTARNYLTLPGKDTDDLEEALETLQGKLGTDFSINADPYLGKTGHRYYKKLLSEWSAEAHKMKDQYHEIGSLMNRAAKKIAFNSLEEEKEFYEVVTSILHLELGKGLRRKIKDKENNTAVVEILNEKQALKKLSETNLDAFLAKKYGNSNKPLISLMRDEFQKDVERGDREEGELDTAVRNLIDIHRAPVIGYDDVKTGAQWIEEIKKTETIYGFDPENTVEDQGDASDGYVYNTRMMAKILAARDLSNAKAGSRRELDQKTISEEELNKKAEEFLAEKDLVVAAFNSMTDVELKSVMKGRGHCGDIDGALKEELLHAEPGSLGNSPVHRHFMPTVKERIEYLQKIAKTGKNSTKVLAAAEILMLRNLVHAHRGKKSSLNKPIPLSDSNSLKRGVWLLAADKAFGDMVLKTNVLDYVGDGHGGLMVDKMREYATIRNNSIKKGKHLAESSNILLNQNTLGGHMELLRRKADILHEQLEKELNAQLLDRDEEKIRSLKEEGEKLLMEYHLCHQEMGKVVKGKVLGPNANIPWLDINKIVENRRQDPRFNNIQQGFTPENMKNIMQHLAEEKEEDFFGKDLSEKTKPMEEEIDDLHIPDNVSEKSNDLESEADEDENEIGHEDSIVME